MRILPPVLSSTPVFLYAAAVYFLAGAGLAYALEFEFINTGDIPLSSTEMAAVEHAGGLWSDRFSDPVTIKINVDWQKPEFFVSDSILASVRIGRTTAPMAMVRDSLLAEADASEQSILSSLPPAIPVSHASTWMNDVSLTLANAKALGITPANDPHYGETLPNNADAHISFNLKHYGHFFYDQHLVEVGKYDFTGIVAHEIGHALGFTSIVDVQSMNPGVLLNPMLLDVFRFPGMASNPSLATDTRQTTPHYAQFFDGILTYAAFGSGYEYFDPVYCALPTARCSASHWDDASGNLMTSASTGTLITIEPDDVHAVDRIGMDQPWRNGIPLINVKAEFYDAGGPLPAYDREKFSTKTEAPPFGSVTPNFSVPPTHAFHISIDGHAGTGFAVFVPKSENKEISAVNFRPLKNAEYDLKKQWEAEADVKDMAEFPAHFSHFYFQSKNSSYHFNFVSTFSNYGAIFDPELGPYGGFRLSGFLDGDLDGSFFKSIKGGDNRKRNDYDATITMLLLLQKPHNIEHGIGNVPFAVQWRGGRGPQDNIMHLIDNTAFGAPSGYNNSSSYQEALKNRLEQLIDDPEPGRDIAI